MTPSRLAKIKQVLSSRQYDLTVVLDHVHNHRNHAAILRTCDAVGIQQMHVVVDPHDHRPFRGTAMGSQQWVDIERYLTQAQALQAVKSQGMQIVVANKSAKAVAYNEIDYCQPTAIVMGAEKKGPSDTTLACADKEIYIPMLGMVESYNVSVAAAIILNEARQQRASSVTYQPCALTPEQYQRCLFRWSYTRLASFCDDRAIPYPLVDEQGHIVDPNGEWRALAKSKER